MVPDSALSRFLTKNTISGVLEMPVFHSTSAYAAKNIIFDGLIEPKQCNVFKDDELVYLFYGRPSYKTVSESQIAKYWQLPSVFIFDYDIAKFERTYPFDTGAFEAGIFPDFFSMMPREEYQVGGSLEAPSRLVSSFFVDTDRYFKLKPRDRRDFHSRFQLGVEDEEVAALYDLVASYSEKVDDRRFAVELQTRDKISISSGKCKAIILPEEYLEYAELLDVCNKQDIEVLSYPSFPLKQEYYYFSIYNVIYELYKKWGFAR